MASNTKYNEKRTPELIESPSKRCKKSVIVLNKPPLPTNIVNFFLIINLITFN